MKTTLSRYAAGFLTAALTFQSSLVFGFGIEAKNHGQGVHELITQKAALASGLLKSQDKLQLQYLSEGVRFNDDPESYLTINSAGDKVQLLGFAKNFLGDNQEKDLENPTKASHFGDYQFLHAMGKSNQTSEDIKNKIILYASHCWRMASNANSLAEFTQDYAMVSAQLANPVNDFVFTPRLTIVKNAIELFPKEVLFLQAKNQLEFQYHAIGSLLHIIQDSYSKGHVVREGWENGTNSGPVLYFQSYSEQDSKEHKKLDSHPEDLSDQNLFEIPGTEIALERSKEILSMLVNKCPITSATLAASPKCKKSLYGFLKDEVFAFAEGTTTESRKTRSHETLIEQKVDTGSDPFSNFKNGSD